MVIASIVYASCRPFVHAQNMPFYSDSWLLLGRVVCFCKARGSCNVQDKFVIINTEEKWGRYTKKSSKILHIVSVLSECVKIVQSHFNIQPSIDPFVVLLRTLHYKLEIIACKSIISRGDLIRLHAGTTMLEVSSTWCTHSKLILTFEDMLKIVGDKAANRSSVILYALSVVKWDYFKWDWIFYVAP